MCIASSARALGAPRRGHRRLAVGRCSRRCSTAASARPGRIGATIGVAVPLLLVALGTIVSTRAGLVNIGQEGQLFLGAAFAAYVGTELGGTGPVVILALLLARASSAARSGPRSLPS